MARQAGRTAPCDRADAGSRLAEARSFLELAGLAESANASVANAVLAGIAASDAACCASLGRMSRGQDHAQAAGLVGTIQPGGKAAARSLARLLSLKDAAQYGVARVSESNRKTALRQAAALVDFAAGVLER